MASNDSQIDKPQHGCPKRAELPDVNINTGAQSINTDRASLIASPENKSTTGRVGRYFTNCTIVADCVVLIGP